MLIFVITGNKKSCLSEVMCLEGGGVDKKRGCNFKVDKNASVLRAKVRKV